MEPARPYTAALAFAAALADGGDAAARGVWVECTPRVREDLALALAEFMVKCWQDNPGLREQMALWRAAQSN